MLTENHILFDSIMYDNVFQHYGSFICELLNSDSFLGV